MTALPSSGSRVGRGSAEVGGPLSRLFDRAGLAYLPDSARELEFDTDMRPGVEKTLLRFTADRGDILMFVALSPALRRNVAERFCGQFRLRTESGDEGGPVAQWSGNEGRIVEEPEHPWWQPELCGSGRRFAYSTERFDFVEVIIDDEGGKVFLRTIR